MDNSEQQYYIVSLKHTQRSDPYITLWRPDDKGYCYRIEAAGKYSESNVAAHLGYYHTGHSDMAVKCEIIDAMATLSKDGYLDIPGHCAPNISGMWFDIMYAPTWPTKNEPKPEYKGARYKKSKVAA